MESVIVEGLVTQCDDKVHRFEFNHLHPCCPFRVYQEGEVILTEDLKKQEKKAEEEEGRTNTTEE